MSRVLAIILHAVPGPAAGPLEAAFARTRRANAEWLADGLARAGAATSIEEVVPGGAPFGARLRAFSDRNRGAGLVVLGSGSVPLASAADLGAFVAAAAIDGPVLANNRYSADIVAIPAVIARRELPGLPGLAADNGLPRWFAIRGVPVVDLARRWRLQVDLDTPLDAYLAGLRTPDVVFDRVRGVVDRLRELAGDPGAELVVAGRGSSGTLRWLERRTASRTRAVIEERGLRTAPPGQRPARSTLGMVLDGRGPGAIGAVLAELGDGALVDTRVLMAHRLGRDELGWPPVEDRFASDLLLHERIADPWLRDLTRAAFEASIPVLLGGHTLVGPGPRLVLGPRRAEGSK